MTIFDNSKSVLLVGFGARAQRVWFPILKNIIQYHDITVVDQKFDNSTEINGTKVLSDIRKVEGKRFDICIIATTPSQHLPLAKFLVKRCGLVIVETPFGDCSSDREELIKLKKIDKRLVLFDNFLYHPVHLLAKQLQRNFGKCVFHIKANDFFGSHSLNQFFDLFSENLEATDYEAEQNKYDLLQVRTHSVLMDKDRLRGLEVAGNFKTNFNRPSRPGFQISFLEKATLVTFPFGNLSRLQRVRRKLKLQYKMHIGQLYTGREIESIYLSLAGDWTKIYCKSIAIENGFAKQIQYDCQKNSKSWIYSSIMRGLKDIAD